MKRAPPFAALPPVAADDPETERGAEPGETLHPARHFAIRRGDMPVDPAPLPRLARGD